MSGKHSLALGSAGRERGKYQLLHCQGGRGEGGVVEVRREDGRQDTCGEASYDMMRQGVRKGADREGGREMEGV